MTLTPQSKHPLQSNWKAIAAMAENRVIGHNNRLPWHLPEDFKFFKRETLGHCLVMGRKTYESIGRPLPGRETIVITRQSLRIDGITVLNSLDALRQFKTEKTLYICGGANLYAQTLPECAELLLTRVKMKPEGDTLFPAFEDAFKLTEILFETPEFTVERYTRF